MALISRRLRPGKGKGVFESLSDSLHFFYRRCPPEAESDGALPTS